MLFHCAHQVSSHGPDRGSTSSLPNSLILAFQAWGTLPQGKCAVIIEAIAVSDLRAAFLGKVHMYTAGEAIVWTAALGLECAARAVLVARP